MDYGHIIKRSWIILKTNKVLWWLGILAAFTSGGGVGIPSFNVPAGGGGDNVQEYQVEPQSSPSFSNADISMARVGKVLGEMTQRREESIVTPELSGVMIAVIVIGVIAMLIIGIIIYYFSIAANAGLITSVDRIESGGEKMSFRSAMGVGRKYFWKIFGAGLLYAAWMIAFLLVIGLLVLVAVMAKNTGLTVIIIALGIVLFIAFLVISFYLALLFLFVPRLIVLDSAGSVTAIKRAHILVKNNWKEALISWIILIAIGLVIGVVLVLLILLIGAIFGLLGFGIYKLAGTGPTIAYGIILGLILLVALFIVRGIITAYTSVYTTLVYRALKYIEGQRTVKTNN